MKTLIKNGKIVTAAETIEADILVEDEKISKVAAGIHAKGDVNEIDASGLLVLPGGVDVHVHLDLPMFGTVSSDDHYTGTKAAAFGGTTTVIDFVSQNSDDIVENIRQLREKADKKVSIDYGFHMNITHLNSKVEDQIPLLPGLGVTSVKVFTAYNNRMRLQDDEIFRLMRLAKEHGILTMLHAENGDLIELLVQEALSSGNTSPIWHARTRPAWGAVEAVCRGAALSAIADAPLYIVHMNVAGEVDQMEYAQRCGIQIYGETCPQYLLFTEEKLSGEDGANWVCSPPLRTQPDKLRLWKGLQDGVVQTIATDHCPFYGDGTQKILYEGISVGIPGKELGIGDFTKIPNGLPGVGDRLPVLWTEMISSGCFSVNQFAALTSSNPAKLFGMYPKKGAILSGSDADLVLWDPHKELTYGKNIAQHRTDYNLYEGWKLVGFPVQVMSRGKTIVKNGEWYGRAGDGRFIHRQLFQDPTEY